jgi:environmental stress-induced protein Ves
MPWKNGLGVTEQIAIFPENSAFPGESFHWRLSSATVQTAAPFSLFKGYDRWLTILSGEGLNLNGSPLGPLKPAHFSGEIPIQSELLSNAVTDLGLIYRRDKIAATMSYETISSARTLYFDRGTHLFYAVAGDLKINDTTVPIGDTLWMEGPFEATLGTSQRGHYIYIKLLS